MRLRPTLRRPVVRSLVVGRRSAVGSHIIIYFGVVFVHLFYSGVASERPVRLPLEPSQPQPTAKLTLFKEHSKHFKGLDTPYVYPVNDLVKNIAAIRES